MKEKPIWTAIALATILVAVGCHTHGDTRKHEAPAMAGQPGGAMAHRAVADAPTAGPAADTSGSPTRTPDLDRAGFVTFLDGGRLWVFRNATEALTEFLKTGEPAKQFTVPGGGPRGVTVKAPDRETLVAYLASEDGFVIVPSTEHGDVRIWVFRAGCPELAAFRSQGELAKHVTRLGVGPLGTTVKAPDRETLDAYAAARFGRVER